MTTPFTGSTGFLSKTVSARTVELLRTTDERDEGFCVISGIFDDVACGIRTVVLGARGALLATIGAPGVKVELQISFYTNTPQTYGCPLGIRMEILIPLRIQSVSGS